MRFDPLEGETIGHSDGSFLIAEWTDDGKYWGSKNPIAPLHRHLEEDEAWYVLEGRLGFRVAEEVVEVGAGGALLVPKGTAHTYWNASPTPCRYLLIMGPKTHALIGAIHAASDRSPEALRHLFAFHEAELLG